MDRLCVCFSYQLNLVAGVWTSTHDLLSLIIAPG